MQSNRKIWQPLSSTTRHLFNACDQIVITFAKRCDAIVVSISVQLLRQTAVSLLALHYIYVHHNLKANLRICETANTTTNLLATRQYHQKKIYDKIASNIYAAHYFNSVLNGEFLMAFSVSHNR